MEQPEETAPAPDDGTYLAQLNAGSLLREAGLCVRHVDGPDMGRGVFALRDFKAGDVIFTESPLAFAPRDSEHCGQCLRKLPDESPVVCTRCRTAAYCSASCAEEAWAAHHRLLCAEGQADELIAQSLRDFHAVCDEQARAYPVLISRLIAQLTTEVTAKVSATPDESVEQALTRPDSLFTHLRHLCAAEIEAQGRVPVEFSMLAYAFGQSCLASLVDEDFCFWLFTILVRNTFGLWIVEPGEAEGVYTDRREDGVGLFLHASYLNHACAPNVDRCNRHGDKRVSFVACADIKQGEQLFIEYVDTRAPVEERRQELAQRYGFVCGCATCLLADQAQAKGE